MANLPSNAEIMAMARQTMRGKCFKSVTLYICMIIIYGILHTACALFAANDLQFSLIMGIFEFLGFAIPTICLLMILTMVKENDWHLPSFDLFRKKFFSIMGGTILVGIVTFLWSLLFIIPGIIAGFNYTLTLPILADEPATPVAKAMKLSKKMMYGNRWKLFCLNFRFVGWMLLLMVCCIGAFIIGGTIFGTIIFFCGFFVLGFYMALANVHFYKLVRSEYENTNGVIADSTYNGMSPTSAVLLSCLVIIWTATMQYASILLKAAADTAQ